jgi:hypothetical protein
VTGCLHDPNALVDHHAQVIVVVDGVHYRREVEINGKLLLPYNTDTDYIH